MKVKVTRKAILIQSPGMGKGFLPAAECDSDNYKKFLLSDRGGRWFENEITILKDPSSLAALNIIQAAIADYVVVYFTGHGLANKNGEKFLCFKDGDIEDLLLLNESPRQRIIIDACRKIPSYAISGLPEEDTYLHADGHYPARELFDNYILNSPVGQTIIHATAHDTKAYASQTGSYFTEALLNYCYSIKTKNYQPLSITKVLKGASIELIKQEDPQKPAITYNTGNLQIPFAFGFSQPVRESRKQELQQIQKKYVAKRDALNSSWLIAGVCVGLLLIAANSDR